MEVIKCVDFIEIRWISSKTQTHDDTDEEKDRFDKERAKSVGVRESQTRGLRGRGSLLLCVSD